MSISIFPDTPKGQYDQWKQANPEGNLEDFGQDSFNADKKQAEEDAKNSKNQAQEDAKNSMNL